MSKFTSVIAIVLLIAIIGGGAFYFVSKLNESNDKIAELETQLMNASEVVKEENKAEMPEEKVENDVVKSVVGKYIGNVEDKGHGDTEVSLILFENGTFAYYTNPHTAEHYEGDYLVENDKLTLKCLLQYGNEANMKKTIDKEISLNINEDILTDSSELNTTLKKSSDEVSEMPEEKEDVKNVTVIGKFVGEVEDKGNSDTEVRLILCENGTFAYYTDPHTDEHYEGYYLIKDDKIILNCLLDCGNDIGASVVDKVISLNINEDTLTDSSELNTTLKKSSEEVSEKVNLSETITTRLKNKALSY